MRISDWSSDVCSSDLIAAAAPVVAGAAFGATLDDGGAAAGEGHVAGAPLDYSGLPGATNRAWDVTLLGELGVPDREALRPRNLTHAAGLKPAAGGAHYHGAPVNAQTSAWTAANVRSPDTSR